MQTPPKVTQWVYMLIGDPMVLKVGFSTHPRGRLSGLRSSIGDRFSRFPADIDRPTLKPFMLTPGDKNLEWRIHRDLSAFRIEGTNEWYRVSDDLMCAIRRLGLPSVPWSALERQKRGRVSKLRTGNPVGRPKRLVACSFCDAAMGVTERRKHEQLCSK